MIEFLHPFLRPVGDNRPCNRRGRHPLVQVFGTVGSHAEDLESGVAIPLVALVEFSLDLGTARPAADCPEIEQHIASLEIVGEPNPTAVQRLGLERIGAESGLKRIGVGLVGAGRQPQFASVESQRVEPVHGSVQTDIFVGRHDLDRIGSLETDGYV